MNAQQANVLSTKAEQEGKKDAILIMDFSQWVRNRIKFSCDIGVKFTSIMVPRQYEPYTDFIVREFESLGFKITTQEDGDLFIQW